MRLDLVYNSGLEFVSKFLFLSIVLNYLYFTSDYHPEDNKQTKYTNQTLDQYLCNYQQENQSKLLSLVEFSIIILLVLLLVSFYSLPKRFVILIFQYILSIILLSPKPETLPSISMNSKVLSRPRSPQPNSSTKSLLICRNLLYPISKVGYKVFMRAQLFRTIQFSKKFSEKCLDHYKIISQPDTLLFTLCLLKSVCFVHLVFYVFILEPAISNIFLMLTQ